ncbi:MAG TPA: hypothetical protein VKP30_19030 [Polyangiaceae bacterium]|nr:hypothetical protein [Polyangiaceae bacterium]
MSYFIDPPRLRESESTPRELRQWLADARNSRPSAAELQGVMRAVEGLGAVDRSGLVLIETVRSPALHSAGIRTAATGAKWWAATAIGLTVAGLGAFWGWVTLHEPGAPSSSRHHTQVAVSQAVPRAKASTAIGEATDALSVETEDQERIKPASSRVSRGRRAGRGAVAGNRSPTPTGTTSPAKGGVEVDALQSVAPKPVVSAEEWRILRAARRAVPSDPGRALVLVREHAEKFPEGMLVQEREAIAIDALARLGRTSEARARSAAFSAQFPGSPYRNRNDAAVSRAVDKGTKQ